MTASQAGVLGLVATMLCAGADHAPRILTQQVFRAGVETVFVPVSVKRGNVAVPGLTSKDFRLTDSGVLQQVEAVLTEALPIDVTVFHDTSPSQAGRLDDLKADVGRIFEVLRPGDRLRLLVFGTNYQVVDAFGWAPAGGRLDLGGIAISPVTSVNDAVLAAIIHRPTAGRRHLVVALTDAVDWGSATTSDAVLDVARRSESVLHLVAMTGASGRTPMNTWKPTGPDRRSVDRLTQAAELTGGQAHSRFLGLGSPDPVETFARVFADFRTSYILRYTATSVPRSGWHEIRVEVPTHPEATIRARRGYWAS